MPRENHEWRQRLAQIKNQPTIALLSQGKAQSHSPKLAKFRPFGTMKNIGKTISGEIILISIYGTLRNTIGAGGTTFKESHVRN